MTPEDRATIEARDRREIEAWASQPHTLYEGHDCIRCQVSRYLRAAEAREARLRKALAGIRGEAEEVVFAQHGNPLRALDVIVDRVRAALAPTEPEAER